jgi:prepilin-type N-terminal cleavage/methylation domain-containing protein
MPSHRQHGFTLIEVMVALLIFLVIALGLAKGEIAALLTQSGNIYRNEALRLAEDELSRLKGERFTLSGTSNDLAQSLWPVLPNYDPSATAIPVNMRNGTTTFVRSIQITDIASTVTALKRIDIAVGWNQGNSTTMLWPTNRNHQISLSSIMAQSD